MRLAVAIAVSTAASTRPTAYPRNSTLIDAQVRCGITPLVIAETNASTVAVKVGKTSGLPTFRAYSSQISASTTSSAALRTAELP